MPRNAPNRLDVLPGLMLSSLPAVTGDSPQLRDPYDALALFSHAAMLSVDFRLVGLGEDHQISTVSSDAVDTKPLPAEWNQSGGSAYAFRYRHAQSSLEFLIKVSRLGKKGLVNALAVDDDKVQSFNIAMADFFSASSFPFSASAVNLEGDSNASSALPTGYSDSAIKAITDLFISPGRFGDLWALFKINIVQKIAPGLHKAGQEDESASSTADDVDAQRQADEETRTRPPPGRQPQNPDRPPQNDPYLPPAAYPRPPMMGGDPLAPEQARPRPHGDLQPPGWDDEYDVLRAPGRRGGPGTGPGGLRQPNLGERDLYPPGLGPHDPLRMPGSSGGLRMPGIGGGGGGMHPTHEDFFGSGGGDEQGFFGDPRSVPPGARFDPPFPGMGPPRGSGGGGFGGPGGFGGGFGGGGII